MLQRSPVTSPNGRLHSPLRSSYFCATSFKSIASNSESFQAQALLANSSHGEITVSRHSWVCSWRVSKRHCYTSVPTKGHFSVKCTHYQTDWHCKCCGKVSLEDMFSRKEWKKKPNKKKPNTFTFNIPSLTSQKASFDASRNITADSAANTP